MNRYAFFIPSFLSLFFCNLLASQNLCNSYINSIKNQGTRLNEITPLSSTLLVKASHYKYGNNTYVIAYMKSARSGYRGRAYLFCGITERTWTQFTSEALYNTSYGESFHKYIMNKKCDCSSSTSTYGQKSSYNKSSIASVLQEKETRWGKNYKIFENYMTEGYEEINTQLDSKEQDKAMEYFKEGFDIYLNPSKTKNIDYSNATHTNWSISQMTKVFNYMRERLNADRTILNRKSKVNSGKRKEILYKTSISQTQSLPLRLEPNYKSKTLTRINKNDIIQVIDTVDIPNNYIKVLSNNQIGFINKSFTEFSNPSKSNLTIQFESLIENIGSYVSNDVKEYNWDSQQKKWELTIVDSGKTEFVFGENILHFKRQSFKERKSSTYVFTGLDNNTGGYVLSDFFEQRILIDIDFTTVIWFAEKAKDGYYTKMYKYNNLKKLSR